MKLKQIKTNAELLEAIHEYHMAMESSAAPREFCEITTVDGTVKAARVGNAHFRMEAYGTVGVFREVQHEEAKRYRLVATVPGFPKQVTYHEDISELSEKKKSYGDGVETDNNGLDQVDVLINDDGKVVREVYKGEPIFAHSAPAKPPADEIQF